MGRLRDIVYVVLSLIVASVVYGCNTSGCLENRSAIPLAGFYSSRTNTAISIDSIEITGIGKADSKPLYDGKSAIKSAYLPMRSTEDQTSWQIGNRVSYDYGDTRIYTTIYDTLTFDYTSRPYFASDECGVIYTYQITHMAYTTHLIDSVIVTDSLITNLDVERIKIYFRTSDPQTDKE